MSSLTVLQSSNTAESRWPGTLRIDLILELASLFGDLPSRHLAVSNVLAVEEQGDLC